MNYTFTSHTGKLLLSGMVACLIAVSLSSCKEDFLDKKPLDQVSQDDYFTKAESLGNFTINYYPTVFPRNDGWNAGMATWDDGTDNQAAREGNTGRFLEDQWRVPSTGGFGAENIRNLNKFITENEQRIADNLITGDKALINHFLGEAYVIRALLYYAALQTYGDYPIVDKELNVDDDLIAAARRKPRNLVARHILADFDKAVSLLGSSFGSSRISKNAAYVLKSRAALYEGTFELYHRGSGRVPGDAGWPGKSKSWNSDFSIDQQAEAEYFLNQAMEAAKVVAEQIPLTTENNHVMDPSGAGNYNGWNPYYDMFASPELSIYPEVILWQGFNNSLGVSHLTSNKLRTGPANGWTRGLVESFLMKNGLPIYAAGSGYKGDTSIDLVKTDRDERLQLFMFGESTPLVLDDDTTFSVPNLVTVNKETMDVTGYRQRKLYNYDPMYQNGQNFSDVDGLIHIRAAEAYLNYIEASYLLTKSIDATARKYWTALRNRAGITASIDETIAATDMSYEANASRDSYDWGAFSAGKAIDATLYSIRRERRSEFAGEGYRWDDLVRWRALDQVKNYQIEGINFWDEFYKKDKFREGGSQQIIADGGATATMSSKELSKYIRPYQIIKDNNILYNGYTFYQAHYLSPFSVNEMQLASPTGKAEDSSLYQNPGWPLAANGTAEY